MKVRGFTGVDFRILHLFEHDLNFQDFAFIQALDRVRDLGIIHGIFTPVKWNPSCGSFIL